MGWDKEQILVLVKQFFRSLVDGWFVLFSILGVALFTSSFLIPEGLWHTVVFSAGGLIVASGTFAGLTRWLSVHGIVKKELENILYGDYYISSSEKFDDVWDKLVSSSIKKHIPSMEPHFHKDVLRQYLPSEKEILYKDYHQSFDVYWEDKDKRIIKVIEKINITLYTSNKHDHKLPYKLIAFYPKEKNLIYEIETLKIDGECLLHEIKSEKTEDNGICRDETKYEINLNGKTDYGYFRKMVRHIYLDYDPFFVIGSGWHTYKPRVTITCHDQGIKAFFTSTGTLKNFKTIDGTNNSHYMQEEYPELMMKAQGYSVYFASQ